MELHSMYGSIRDKYYPNVKSILIAAQTFIFYFI